MDISSKFRNKLVEHGYRFIDGGSFTWEKWSKVMIDFITASNNDLLDLTDEEITEVVEEIWQAQYEVNTQVHPLCIWANIIKENTEINNEMRHSIDRLFKAIDDYRGSQFFKELLEFCSKFKELAPYNAMIVKTQMPAARYVLSKNQWLEKYGRKIKRNARPLIILRKYGPVDYVFEISDTEQGSSKIFYSDEEILRRLESPYETSGTVDEKLYHTLVHNLSYYGISLEGFRVAASFGAQIQKASSKIKVDGVDAIGHYIISVNEKANMSTAFASICHELGHLFCYHMAAPTTDWWKMRDLTWEQEEFEAEIVSFIICERYGVGNKSWEYLSQVLGRHDEIPEGISIERIFKAANEVERMLNPELDVRSCYLYSHDTDFKRRYDKAHSK